MKNSKFKRWLLLHYERLYSFRHFLIIRTKYRLHIMGPVKTVRYILKTKCSIARYGDGEFMLMQQIGGVYFQKGSPRLADSLCSVMMNRNESLLICIPGILNSFRDCNDNSREYWKTWSKEHGYEKYVEKIRDLSGKKYRFGDSQITRPYIDWKNNKRAKKLFPLLKKIWDGRDILIVEGDQSRLGVGNDLFDGARSIKRILAPAENAFERYDEICDCILKHAHDRLVLLALGPTATVLASYLANLGYQAIDIGHIDIEYEWFLSGAKEKTAIHGKYTNEVASGREFTECTDERYLPQIIEKID